MESTNLYYIGTDPHSFRSGEPAEIIDVMLYERDNGVKVPCFHINFADGKEDWAPISDFGTYKVVSYEEIEEDTISNANFLLKIKENAKEIKGDKWLKRIKR